MILIAKNPVTELPLVIYWMDDYIIRSIADRFDDKWQTVLWKQSGGQTFFSLFQLFAGHNIKVRVGRWTGHPLLAAYCWKLLAWPSQQFQDSPWHCLLAGLQAVLVVRE